MDGLILPDVPFEEKKSLMLCANSTALTDLPDLTDLP